MSDLERAGDGLAGLFERLGFGKPAHLARIMDDWDDIAGSVWGSAARPVGLEGGLLTLEVDSGMEATRLKYHGAVLVERLAARLGEGVVTGIKVRVATPRSRRAQPPR